MVRRYTVVAGIEGNIHIRAGLLIMLLNSEGLQVGGNREISKVFHGFEVPGKKKYNTRQQKPDKSD